MGVCIDIPECIELKPHIKHDEKVLHIDATNRCDYDLMLFLYIKNRQNQVLQNISIDIKASERKHIEVSIAEVGDIVISGEWGLKGTSLKLPLKEIALSI